VHFVLQDIFLFALRLES